MTTNLQDTVRLKAQIEKNGLSSQFKRDIAFFYKQKRKGNITETEYLRAYDVTLTTLGRGA